MLYTTYSRRAISDFRNVVALLRLRRWLLPCFFRVAEKKQGGNGGKDEWKFKGRKLERMGGTLKGDIFKGVG